MLSAEPAHGIRTYLDAVSSPGAGVDTLLPLLAEAGSAVPSPGGGQTVERFSMLASVAAADVTAARVLEPHLDALAILSEAGHGEAEQAQPGSASWGVFAAEAPGTRLEATESRGRWSLTGVKPWCSLGDRLDAALVTAHTGPSSRRLFAVDLHARGVNPVDHEWAAAGLGAIDTGPLRFDAVPAEPIGDDGWYLTRAGFEWGAIGVAAIWWGGTLPLCQAISDAARRRSADALLEHRVGRLWQLMDAARTSLENAARLIDGDEPLPRDEWAAIAHSARGATIAAVDDALAGVRDVIGAAALTFDSSIARRHADLQTYTAQYHRLRDPGSIGRRVLEGRLRW